MASSTNRTTFGGVTTLIPATAGGAIANLNGLANSAVVKTGNTYHLLVDGCFAAGPQWQLLHFTATALAGPWTPAPAAPLTSLEVIAGGIYGSPSVWIDPATGLIHLWFHGGSGNTPNNAYHATSTDWINWTVDDGPILAFVPGASQAEADQLADLDVQEVSGNTFVWFDVDNNVGGYWAQIGLAVYPGPRPKLVQVPPVLTLLAAVTPEGQ
jgi:hypothetical protein